MRVGRRRPSDATTPGTYVGGGRRTRRSEAPRQLRSAADEDDAVTITRRVYDEESVVAIDLGPDVEATVDVVDGTAIVVAGGRQFEFEVPPEATEITANDGILVIRESG